MIRAVMKRTGAFWVGVAAFLLVVGSSARAGGNFSISPGEAERRFGQEIFEIVEAKKTASGVAGAQKWKLRFRDGAVVKAKWKAAPNYVADGWNNSPRREIAAYEIQKWFLDPQDYIVPTSEVRCIPLAAYRAIEPDARPTLRGIECVYGVLSLWLEGVEEPPEIWHPELFEQGGYYRFSVAAMNILTFLIGHQDGRPANFLWSTDDNRHVYSIDNGISFHAFPYNFLVKNWNGIRVPALPRKVIDRLARVSPEQIQGLAILRHLEADATGVLQVKPASKNLDPGEGTRLAGTTLQFGLRASEVKEVEKRLGQLVQRTQSGSIPLF
jgi:hypothetical protein